MRPFVVILFVVWRIIEGSVTNHSFTSLSSLMIIGGRDDPTPNAKNEVNMRREGAI